MAEEATKKSFADKLMSLNKPTLYGVLIAAAAIPLFFPVDLPNKPNAEAVDFYEAVHSVPEGSTILIGSDWTNSTRGESRAQFSALMRILMRRNVKFAVYSADPQGPEVVKDTIRVINEERVKANQRPYERWNDWVMVGYFSNLEGTANAMAGNIRGIFGGRTDVVPGGGNRPVFESPVLQNIRRVEDFPLLVVVTASKTSTITIERLYGKVPLAFMVTGVMGPETLVYYSSGQLLGVSAGLKGAYDLEALMENGVVPPGTPDAGKAEVSSNVTQPIPGFPGQLNRDRATRYYPSLHFALGLMIIAVIVGNVGMLLSRRAAR